MTWRRLGLAGLMAAAAAILAASCSAIIGAEVQVHDVVVDMCNCNDKFGFLGTKQECQAYLRAQLDGVTEGTRAAWLDRYASACGTCDTDLDCFYTAPICKTLACGRSDECCSVHDGGGCDDAGQCL